MSAITYLTNIVTSLTNRFNQLESNSKKVDELPAQTTLDPNSKIPVSRGGTSEHLTIQKIISSIQNSNYNQLTSIGAITIDGTDIIVEPVSGTINGSNYATTTDTTIPIVLCESGFNRKDILVLTTSNAVVAISGEETGGSIVIAPPVPLDAIYITEFDVSDSTIGAPIDPIVGVSFVEKLEANPFISNVSGTDAIIPLDPNGYSEIRLQNSGLVSIAGYDLSLITGNANAKVPYPGKPYIIRNLTGNNITIKNELSSADYPFYLTSATDLVFPNNQAIYVSYDGSGFIELFKSWSEADNTKLDKSTTPSSIYATDASGNQEMISKDSFQTALGFTPENLANKENTTLDTSTTKYPTNNLVKTNLDLKQNTLVSGTSIKTIEGQSILGSGNIDLNKTQVGLSNVDNTSDLNKPISTATQTALDLKLDKVSTVDEEKVYIINADGSQGVKPTSDFYDLKQVKITTSSFALASDNGCLVKIKGNATYTIDASTLPTGWNIIVRTFAGATGTFVAGGSTVFDAPTGLILRPLRMCSIIKDSDDNKILINGETTLT